MKLRPTQTGRPAAGEDVGRGGLPSRNSSPKGGNFLDGFPPFTCLKIKNSSPHVSCVPGSICLYNRVSGRSEGDK